MEVEMNELNLAEIDLVSGGMYMCSARRFDWVPCAQSDWGHRLNDATNMLGEWGSWLGRNLYDWTH